MIRTAEHTKSNNQTEEQQIERVNNQTKYLNKTYTNKKHKHVGPFRVLNLGPLARKARILPLYTVSR